MIRKKSIVLLMALSLVFIVNNLSAQTVVYDDSDAFFTILAQMVTVLTPNGGESWNGGETQNITWSLDASIANVNIDYSTNSGSIWIPVARILPIVAPKRKTSLQI